MIWLASIVTLLGVYLFGRAHGTANDNHAAGLQALACGLLLAGAACWAQVL